MDSEKSCAPSLCNFSSQCVNKLCCSVKSCIGGESLAAAERSLFFASNYSALDSVRNHCASMPQGSHNGAAQRRTMSQIPDHSPQVQRPGWHLKTAELQWLCFSTLRSFPTGYLRGNNDLCVRACVFQGGYNSLWEHREGFKDGGGSLFWLYNQSSVNKKLATKIWTEAIAFFLFLILFQVFNTNH